MLTLFIENLMSPIKNRYSFYPTGWPGRCSGCSLGDVVRDSGEALEHVDARCDGGGGRASRGCRARSTGQHLDLPTLKTLSTLDPIKGVLYTGSLVHAPTQANGTKQLCCRAPFQVLSYRKLMCMQKFGRIVLKHPLA